MRTVCPSCQAAYDVPEAVLAARRTLRCARCSTDFTALPDAPAPPPALPSPALPSPALDSPAPLPPIKEPGGRWPGDAVYLATPPAPSRLLAGMQPAVLAGWVVSFVALGAMGWAFVAWRAPIMQAWPASARLYGLLRLG